MAATEETEGALATAAVAAAAGAAVYGLRKALASRDSAAALPARDERADREDWGEGLRSHAGSLLSTVMDSVSGSLLPLAEEAADAAGKWVAENSSDVARERVVPRFIEAFNDAN
jgi:hypothetical protein